MKDELTPKQERFCQEYLVDLNATQAAIRSGYSAKTANVKGSQLLAKVNIKQRVSELKDEVARNTDVDISRVVSMLLDSYEDAKAAGQHGPAVRAVELLGKRLGAFVDRVEVNDIQRKPSAELIIVIAEGDPAIAARLINRFSMLEDSETLVKRVAKGNAVYEAGIRSEISRVA